MSKFIGCGDGVRFSVILYVVGLRIYGTTCATSEGDCEELRKGHKKHVCVFFDSRSFFFSFSSPSLFFFLLHHFHVFFFSCGCVLCIYIQECQIALSSFVVYDATLWRGSKISNGFILITHWGSSVCQISFSLIRPCRVFFPYVACVFFRFFFLFNFITAG